MVVGSHAVDIPPVHPADPGSSPLRYLHPCSRQGLPWPWMPPHPGILRLLQHCWGGGIATMEQQGPPALPGSARRGPPCLISSLTQFAQGDNTHGWGLSTTVSHSLHPHPLPLCLDSVAHNPPGFLSEALSLSPLHHPMNNV